MHRFQQTRSFLKHDVSRPFLLGKNLAPGIREALVVRVKLLLRFRFKLYRFGARAHDQRGPLIHRFFDGLEKSPAGEQIEKENENDCGHSFKEEFTELVKNIHR